MKLSENWLREWLNIPADIKTWSKKLTTAGLEVEAITTLGADLENICVGSVLAVKSHPNADRLKVCEVAIGGSTPLIIVCGATNVRPALKVVVAQVGAVLPNNIKIQLSKIRGVESSGMLCSASELGLSESSTGIVELPEDAPIGLAINEYLNLPDHIIDINITPNRGDCLSIAGLARELAAVGNWSLAPIALKEIPAVIADTLPLDVVAVEDCPRYVGRIIQNIRTNAATPIWMQERLKRSNMRCIHPVVDIMNYVMLELGQPLHAFDLSTIKHSIQIRKSNTGEIVELLDCQTITLADDALVIADQEKILALAGIMGGIKSAVSATTTTIFIESAFFAPDTIATTLRKLRLQSDAAYRFERGVDPELALRAMHRASELVLAICGGQAGTITEKTAIQYLPKPKEILLRATQVQRILGIALAGNEIENLLHRLNLFTHPDPQGWQVKIPTYRFDINLEIDLIEEIARVHGYENIPSQTMQAPMAMQKVAETRLSQQRIRDHWVDSGYHEAIHYSFTDPKLADLLDPQQKLFLHNPISADLAVMRTTLWGGLLQSAIFNLNRQQSSVKLFEIGTCFLPAATQTKEILKLSGIAVGTNTAIQWGITERNIDFFDIKGDLENLFALTKDGSFEFVQGDHPALHPRRCTKILRAGKCIGFLGELHPTLQQTLDVPQPIYLFELNLADLVSAQLPSYITPSKYPAVTRDLAFIVQDSVNYHHIHEAVYQSCDEILQNLQLFDVYKGPEIATDRQSVALSLTFQADSRTLTDEEVEQAMQAIITELGKRFEIVVRDKKV